MMMRNKPALGLGISTAARENEQSVNGNDSTTHSAGQSAMSQSESRITIAKEESKKVCWLRMVLFTVLLVVAAAISAFVYWYTRRNEKEDFEMAFLDQGLKVVDEFQTNADRRLKAVESLAVTITSTARAQNMTWPNVTLDDFERRVTFTLDLAELVSIILLPFVTKETRAGWEDYSVAHQGWFEEGLNLQGDVARFEDDEMESRNIIEKTWNRPTPGMDIWPHLNMLNGSDLVYDTSENPYGFAPWWQFAPVILVPGLVNYDTLSHPTRKPNIEALMKTSKPLATEAWDYSDVSNTQTVGKKAALNQFLNRRKNVGKYYQDGPVSDLYFPVFENVDANNEEDRPVGALTAYVYWQVYFDNILPPGSDEVIAVLENSCGQSFTYSIQGDIAFYAGNGDLHNRDYDDLAVTTNWNAFLGGDARPEDLYDGQCIYKVRVYPSSQMEDAFMTNTPMYFTIVLVCTFLFTSLVFMYYDHVVEKRQMIVMKQAVQTTEVVNTLFPAQVRERLFEERNANASSKGKSDEEAQTADAGCIADVYENATVMFGDLAGFTAWSNGREPKDVFNLLETLYGAFDKIAKRRCVFKVETIGDCYLCVTGVPRPQEKHALTMARFAHECLLEMNRLLEHKLVPAHGEETGKLSLRVGLNSGPVTAGVLRGDRARFQLFGDTVNTAARMESTGVAGRIQVSADTAKLICDTGKPEWIKPREGGVEAKGKGRMETFWCEPKLIDIGARSSCSGSTSNYSSDGGDSESEDEK